jgi:SAM-dependent methyltransferase
MLPTAKRLEIRLRMAAPRFLRTLYRFANSLREHEPSRNLPPELIRDCRFFASREDMLDFLPRSGRVAEFGTLAGKFAKEILRRNNPAELYLIDIDTSRIDLQEDGRVHIRRGLAHEIIAGFPDRYFDWIYIDADHSYAGTLRDATAAAEKIKPGGLLVFNDFAHIDPDLGRYGVHRAVVDFVIDRGWPLRCFAFERHALYDVAIERPN